MKNKKRTSIQLFKYSAVTYIMCSSTLFIGCTVQPDIIGPNGYQIVCDKGWNCSIDKDAGTHLSMMIEPEVDKYFISGQYIIGHVVRQNISASQGAPPPPIFGQQPGYFILDTQSNSVTTGLNEVECRTRLLHLGINNFQLKNTYYNPSRNQTSSS